MISNAHNKPEPAAKAGKSGFGFSALSHLIKTIIFDLSRHIPVHRTTQDETHLIIVDLLIK